MKKIMLVMMSMIVSGCSQCGGETPPPVPPDSRVPSADAALPDAALVDAKEYVCDPFTQFGCNSSTEGCFVEEGEAVCLPAGQGIQLSDCGENANGCSSGYQCSIPVFQNFTKCGAFCDLDTGKTHSGVLCKDLPRMNGEGRCIPLSFYGEEFEVGICTKCSRFKCPKD